MSRLFIVQKIVPKNYKTGSGKTTTMYALLEVIRKRKHVASLRWKIQLKKK